MPEIIEPTKAAPSAENLSPTTATAPKESPELSPWPDFVPRTSQEWVVWICGGGLLVSLLLPWATFEGTLYLGIGISKFDNVGYMVFLIPVLASLALVWHRQTRGKWSATACVSYTWFCVMVVFLKLSGSHNILLGIGATSALFFATGLFAAAGRRGIVATANFAARKLNSRRGDVSSHWGTHVPNFQLPVKEFYANVEEAIRERQIPGLEILRVPFLESTLLSHRREYLRVIRDRQVFDICAAPFGTGFFFSCRELEIPLAFSIRGLIGVFLAVPLVGIFFMQLFGVLGGFFAFGSYLLFGACFMFAVGRSGLQWLDLLLLRVPIIGMVYEAWFRRDTYFNQDTRLFYLTVINELIRAKVEEITASKGVTLLNMFERQPILDELYRRRSVKIDADRGKTDHVSP